MILFIERDTFTANSTTGKLYVGNVVGAPFCYTLEPPEGQMLIPEGTYPFKLIASPKFTEYYKYPFVVPVLQDVPGHSAEEIHIGNTAKDTLGCTLVGGSRAADSIQESEVAFFGLMHQVLSEYVADPNQVFSAIYSHS